MLLQNKFSSRTLMRLTMSSLLLFFGIELVARLAPAHVGMSPDVVDGVRGVFLGISIGLMILALRASRAS